MPKRCEVLVYDGIGGWFGLRAGDVSRQLRAEQAADEVLIRIHSPGGDALAGVAINNILRSHKGRKVVMIEGLAASAASMVAMAGDEIVMAENAMMMLHNPWSIAIGDAEAMRHEAGVLDAIGAAYVAGYQRKTGKEAEEIRALMERETWLTAEECVRLGLADRVGPPIQIQAKLQASAAWNRKNLPARVARLITGAPAAPGTGAEMPLKDEEELVPKSELTAAQSRVTALELELAGHKLVLAAVATATGKSDPQQQIVGLTDLATRAAKADELEGEALIAQLRQRKLPPVAIKIAQAGGLAALRAAVADESIKGTESHRPAGPQGSEPPEVSAAMTEEEFAIYRAAGCKTKEEAVAMRADGEALDKTRRAG